MWRISQSKEKKMEKRVLKGLAFAGAAALLLVIVAGAMASPNDITLLSRAGVPFVSTWAGAPGPGGAVEITDRPGTWNTALLPDAQWIWSETPVTGGRGATGDVVKFTDTFELACTPTTAQLSLDITADNEYRVYLNGQPVADSDWKEVSDTCPRYIDDNTYRWLYHYDVSGPFQSGTNTLVFDVLNLPCYSDSGNPGGLIYKAVITYDCTIQVGIDIKPGSDPNCFNSDGHGVIPVAILGSADFDVSTVDPFSVSLDGAGVRVKGKSGNAGALEDVNGDGFQDLVVQIIDENGYTTGDTTATLNGLTYDGVPIIGSDTICIRPPE